MQHDLELDEKYELLIKDLRHCFEEEHGIILSANEIIMFCIKETHETLLGDQKI